MARRSAATADSVGSPGRVAGMFRALKHFTIAALAITGVVFAVWLYLAIDNLLVTDSRFFLPGPPEAGASSEFFSVTGIRNVTDDQIIQVFARDFGRSVFLCPLRERRYKLLGIDWVKEASISRLWPNRLAIRITERTPVAFAQMPAADGSTLHWLIDDSGVLLDPHKARRFKLPVLTGLTRKEGDASRRERVKRFLRMQSELGSSMEKLSEIDLSEADNIKAIQQVEDRAITLLLGNQNFRQRYQNFVDSQEDIRKRVPDATILDLRLPDRITVVPPGGAR